TATQPSWAAISTTVRPERRGCSPAAAGCGASRAASSSAAARWEAGRKGAPWGGAAAATRPSWAGPTMTTPQARRRGSHARAAWVFTRSGGVWSQQGGTLVGTGAVGSAAHQGWSVALSADGNTALVGGRLDNFNAGATWVFTRSGGVWSQQGSKLVGTGAVGG